MQRNFFCFLKQKYKEYVNYIGKATNGTVLGIMIVSSVMLTLVMTIWSVSTTGASATIQSEGRLAEVNAAVITEIEEFTMTTEKETARTTTNVTSISTSIVTTSSTTSSSTTTVTATTTTTTETTSVSTAESEIVTEVVYSQSVGQYGFAINPEEYVYLAEVIEHEGANCPLYVKEHIGICILNRVFVQGFMDTIYGCKEQSGQYFSGDYAYGDESAELAKSIIAAYNSGGDYWAQYCIERGLNCRTKYQRNDYCVPGTKYVNEDYDCTSGGFWFHLYYSE